MASSASISGLASGLDTATIITQLMQLEAAPQARLKTKVTTEQSTLTTLQNLNTTFASLATKAADLARPTALNPITATSSSDFVTARAQAGAAPGALSVTINAVALTHRLTFTSTAALTDAVAGGSTTVRLTLTDGTERDLDTGDGTLRGLVSALNASGTGVRASTLRLDDGTYRLIVESATTGAASGFTLTALDGSPLLGGATVRAGQDAALTIGSDTVHSSTNTFTGVLPGVDVTLSPSTPPGTAVDLTLTSDATSAAGSVKALVDAINAVLSDIDSASKPAVGKATPLAGDSAMLALRSALTSSVFPTDGTSLATVGIQLDRGGRLTFDQAAFEAACAADPSRVTAAISGAGGLADRVEQVATGASSSVDGTLTTAISGRKAQISRLQASIDSWDVRLDLRRATLSRQFTALETALSQVQAQSSWLAGQIASLSTSSSSSSS